MNKNNNNNKNSKNTKQTKNEQNKNSQNKNSQNRNSQNKNSQNKNSQNKNSQNKNSQNEDEAEGRMPRNIGYRKNQTKAARATFKDDGNRIMALKEEEPPNAIKRRKGKETNCQ